MSRAVYVIAEMACSHDGDPALARRIIDAAATAKADAIQFQIWDRNRLVTPHHPAYPVLSRIELTRDDWRALRSHIADLARPMEVVACVYELSSLAFAEELQIHALKIHSGDLCDRALIEAAARSGKRMHLCVGAAPHDEIGRAVDWAREAGAREIWLLDGYQAFPTRPDDVHLEHTRFLRKAFALPVGYQDHSDAESEEAFWLPAAALGMGVRALEKHLTHDRARRGMDHHAALNPEEFTRFVKMVRAIEAAMGARESVPSSVQRLAYRKGAQKSLVAARDLSKGALIAHEDLLCLRAVNGALTPDEIGAVVGRRLRCDAPAYSPITPEHLA